MLFAKVDVRAALLRMRRKLRRSIGSMTTLSPLARERETLTLDWSVCNRVTGLCRYAVARVACAESVDVQLAAGVVITATAARLRGDGRSLDGLCSGEPCSR